MITKETNKNYYNIKSGKWNGKKCDYRKNRIIVKLKPVAEDSRAAVRKVCDSIMKDIPQGQLLRSPNSGGRVIYSVDPSSSIPTLARKLSKRDDIEYAEPDVVDQPAIIPNDTRFSEQWSHNRIGSVNAWDLETGDPSKVLIGIIDSGISMSAWDTLDHPDLNDTSRYILGTDFVDGGTPRDVGSHGTHVAGIAAAESNNNNGVAGMNWRSNVYICRTLGPGGGSSSDFAAAIEEIVDFAVANNLKTVINYSAGGGENQTKRDACQYVEDHGMILCAATGNDNGGIVIWPAAYSTDFDGVIAVGSTDEDDTVSSFSNIGPEVTVVAPGRDILSTTPTYSTGPTVALNYDFFDGTSMATPLVTGLVSLMWSRHPGFTNRRIRDCLTGTAVKLGSGSFNNNWGFGRVDAERALRCGDFVLPTFTRFTIFTLFTQFTRFTRFTQFTRFTNFTKFTAFTLFTRFTRFTRFTQFTKFTFLNPDPEPPIIRPFIRFGETVFDAEELAIERFSALDDIKEDLHHAGLETIDQIATRTAQEITALINVDADYANQLIKLSQDLMYAIVEDNNE